MLLPNISFKSIYWSTYSPVKLSGSSTVLPLFISGEVALIANGVRFTAVVEVDALNGIVPSAKYGLSVTACASFSGGVTPEP